MRIAICDFASNTNRNSQIVNRKCDTWSTGGNLNSWKETFIYDYNGNIKTLVRHGKSQVATAMDSLTYNYTANTNKLTYVDDAVNSANYSTDIDDQASGNYSYDKIGNLVSDVSEEIDTIVWNVYGKIERVVRTSNSERPDLEFRYDAMGNRICKIVKPRTGGSGILNQDEWTYTYYLRDASGNVIAVYDRDYTTPAGTYKDVLNLKEAHLYGSSRVGIRSVTEEQVYVKYNYSSTNSDGTFVGTFSSRTSAAASTTNFNHELRRKSFELSNHLGNVLVTVSDARTANNNGGGTVVSFNAIVVSAQDYYAFGSTMVGRSYTGTSYRYTFNGKEKENEIAEGDLDFGARVYDSRLGKFLSPDNYEVRFASQSPYIFAGCSPIISIDDNGDSLRMKFAKAALMDLYVIWLNRQLEGQFEAQVKVSKDVDGYNMVVNIVATANGGDVSKMSKGGQEFYRRLTQVTTSKTTDVLQEIVYNDPSITGGNYETGQVDLGDLMEFDRAQKAAGGKGPSGRGVYVHELVEQYLKSELVKKGGDPGSGSASNPVFLIFHTYADKVENEVDGSVRHSDGFTFTNPDGSITTVKVLADGKNGKLNLEYSTAPSTTPKKREQPAKKKSDK